MEGRFVLNSLALKSEGSVQRHRNWNLIKSTCPVFITKKSHGVDHIFENFQSAIKKWKSSNMDGRFFSEQFGTTTGRIGGAASELKSHKVNLPCF
jgi:hypothetical protein